MREAVTLLFTDIQGSTRLWETEPRAMFLALRAHDALCREAVRDHAGVVVKMTGDGLYAAFDRPADAAGAAVQLLRALADPARTAGLAIRSRCALHMGEVERRDGDLFGPAVNRVARIMSAAHGGQVLLSAALVAAMARPPRGCGVKDLGRVRLKDLASAEHVYQLTHPDLQHEFPALRSLESVPNNLPRLLTRFVGRQRELQELAALLDEARLVTVLANGGVGKTRLTLQAAATLLDAFDDGVWFIDLAPLREEQLVEPTIARVLGLQLEADRPARDTLGRHLIDKHALLLLDNCEHLAGAAEALLAACPRLAIVATSREVIGDDRETAGALSTLSLVRRHRGEPRQALELEREALTLFRGKSHRFGEAVSLLHLGEYLHIEGDVVGATQHLTCCLQIGRDMALAEIESDALLALADVALTGGDAAGARRHTAASLEVARTGGLRTNEARSSWYLGRVALRDRDAATARRHLAEALAELVALEAREAAIECLLESCVLTALDADDHARHDSRERRASCARRSACGPTAAAAPRWRPRCSPCANAWEHRHSMQRCAKAARGASRPPRSAPGTHSDPTRDIRAARDGAHMARRTCRSKPAPESPPRVRV